MIKPHFSVNASIRRLLDGSLDLLLVYKMKLRRYADNKILLKKIRRQFHEFIVFSRDNKKYSIVKYRRNSSSLQNAKTFQKIFATSDITSYTFTD